LRFLFGSIPKEKTYNFKPTVVVVVFPRFFFAKNSNHDSSAMESAQETIVLDDGHAPIPVAIAVESVPDTAKLPAKKKARKKIVIATEAEPEIVVVGDEDDLSGQVEPRLPIGRVKNFMKMSTEGKNMASDAVYLVTKATVCSTSF
jgi:hypothetical protein